MTYYELDDDLDLEDEDLEEMPEVWLSEPGPCCVCGQPGQGNGCFRCGKPVCMDAQNYMNDAPSGCGSWILDWWSNGAMSPDDGNEYWCKHCLAAEAGEPEQESLSRSLVRWDGSDPHRLATDEEVWDERPF